MATSIKDPSAVFSKAKTSRRLATRRKLVGHYIFGTDFPTSSINWAGGPPLVVKTGVPTYGPGYASITSLSASNSGFETIGVSTESNMTCMAVWSNSNSTGKCPPLFISVSGYWGFVQAVGNNIADLYNMQSGVGSSVADMPMPISPNYYFFVGRMPATNFGELFKGVDTAGVLSLTKATAEVIGGPAVGSSRKVAVNWQIGTANAGQGQSTVPIKVSEIAIWHDLLTDAEILETYRLQKAVRVGSPIIIL